MADTLVDSIMLAVVPKLSEKEAKKLEQLLNSSMKSLGAKSGQTFSKGFFGKFGAGFNNIKGNWQKMAGAGATVGLLMGMKNQSDKVMTNLEEQIALADTLSTTASQTGMKTIDFAKLYTIIRSGDVSKEATIKSIQEFAKRLGEYQKTGAKSEVFSSIKDPQNIGKAFLEATALIGQEKDAGKRAYLIDQFLGGQGVEQLAEFFTKDISSLIKDASGTDYTKLGQAIDALGSQDDIIKKKRLALEQKNLIYTAIKTKGQGGEFVSKGEEFDLNQLMMQTDPETMKNVRTGSEAISVTANAAVAGAGALMNSFASVTKKAVHSLSNFGSTVDETTKNIQSSTPTAHISD